jgi:hydrogenase expression/formation protein HypE
MARAAENVGVPIVTGDTKVVERGCGDGVFINTTGLGMVAAGVELSAANARPGDCVILSGSLGDHGITILTQRQGLELEGAVESDSAPLHSLVAAILAAAGDVRVMRDPTRGGLASTLNEIAVQSHAGIAIRETALPIHDGVRGACEVLGLDPLYVANEGKLIAIVPAASAEAALAAMRRHPLGAEAAIIGEVVERHAGLVTMHTPFGTTRIVDMLPGDQLPRIC